MSDYKVALVGCGAIAPTHLAYLIEIPDVEVVALCDQHGGRLETLGRKVPGARRFETYGAMLEEASPDVLHILTPPSAAAELAVPALERGIHVLVEKPMARTVEEARRMLSAARAGDALLGVDHSRWLHPSVVRARETLARGLLGDLVSVEVVQGYAPSTLPKPAEGGAARWILSYPWGILENLLPHSLYLCRGFTGQPGDLVVQATSGGRAEPSPFDDLRILWQGEHAVGQIILSLAGAPERNTVTLRGTRATLTVDTNQVTEILHRDLDLPRMLAKAAASLDLAWQYGRVVVRNFWAVARKRLRPYPEIQATLQAFYAALRAETTPLSDGVEGLAIVELMSDVRSQVARQVGVPE